MTYVFSHWWPGYPGRVSPFGNPRIKVSLQTNRGLSHATTSFIASYRLGIHRMRLFAWPYNLKQFVWHVHLFNYKLVISQNLFAILVIDLILCLIAQANPLSSLAWLTNSPDPFVKIQLLLSYGIVVANYVYTRTYSRMNTSYYCKTIGVSSYGVVFISFRIVKEHQ